MLLSLRPFAGESLDNFPIIEFPPQFTRRGSADEQSGALGPADEHDADNPFNYSSVKEVLRHAFKFAVQAFDRDMTGDERRIGDRPGGGS